MVTRTNYDKAYSLFLAQESYNQNSILRYSTECVCIESGDLRGISVLNEGIGNGLKSIINKIIETVSAIFKKFSERMSEFFLSANTFLDKYKDIIAKPVKERSLTIYKYNVDKITNGFAIPTLGIAAGEAGGKIGDDSFMKLLEPTEDKARIKAFVETYYSNSGIKYDEDKSLEEMVSIALRGEEEIETKTTTMDTSIPNMYKYCKNYKATKTSLDKDADQIDKNKVIFESILSKIDTKVAVPDNATPATEVPKESTGVWSSVTGCYLHELNVDKDTQDTKNAANSVRVGGQGVGSENKEQVQAGVTSAVGKGTTEEDKKKILSSFETGSKTFFTCCGNVIAAKLSVSSQMYKEFFQLIKMHIRDYVADADETKK